MPPPPPAQDDPDAEDAENASEAGSDAPPSNDGGNTARSGAAADGDDDLLPVEEPHTWIDTKGLPSGDVTILLGTLDSPIPVPAALSDLTRALEVVHEHHRSEIKRRSELVGDMEGDATMGAVGSGTLSGGADAAGSHEDGKDPTTAHSARQGESEDEDEDDGGEADETSGQRRHAASAHPRRALPRGIALAVLIRKVPGACVSRSYLHQPPRTLLLVYPGVYPSGAQNGGTWEIATQRLLADDAALCVRGLPLDFLLACQKPKKASNAKARSSSAGPESSGKAIAGGNHAANGLHFRASAPPVGRDASLRRRGVVPLVNDALPQRILEERYRRLQCPTIHANMCITGPTPSYHRHGSLHATPTTATASGVEENESVSRPSPILFEHLNLVGGVCIGAQTVVEISQCNILLLDAFSSEEEEEAAVTATETAASAGGKTATPTHRFSKSSDSLSASTTLRACLQVHAHAKPLIRECCITSRHDPHIAAWYDKWYDASGHPSQRGVDKGKLMRSLRAAPQTVGGNGRTRTNQQPHESEQKQSTRATKKGGERNDMRFGIYVYPHARGLIQQCLFRCWNTPPVLHAAVRGYATDAPPPPHWLAHLVVQDRGTWKNDSKTKDQAAATAGSVGAAMCSTHIQKETNAQGDYVRDVGCLLHGESVTSFRSCCFAGGDINLSSTPSSGTMVMPSPAGKDSGVLLPCSRFQRCDFVSARRVSVRLAGPRPTAPIRLIGCVFSPFLRRKTRQTWLSVLEGIGEAREADKEEEEEEEGRIDTALPYALHCSHGATPFLQGCVAHYGHVHVDASCIVPPPSQFPYVTGHTTGDGNDDNGVDSSPESKDGTGMMGGGRTTRTATPVISCLENYCVAGARVSTGMCDGIFALKGFEARDDVLSLPRAAEHVEDARTFDYGDRYPASLSHHKGSTHASQNKDDEENNHTPEPGGAEEEDEEGTRAAVRAVVPTTRQILDHGYVLLDIGDIGQREAEYKDSYDWNTRGNRMNRKKASET